MNEVWLSSYVVPPGGNSGFTFSPIAAAVLRDGSLFTSFAPTEPGATADYAEAKLLWLLCVRESFGAFQCWTDSKFLVDGWQSWRKGKLLRARQPHADLWQRIEATGNCGSVNLPPRWQGEVNPLHARIITRAKRHCARLISANLPHDCGIAFIDDIDRQAGVPG